MAVSSTGTNLLVSGDTDEKLEALATLVSWLLTQVREQTARVETLRALLQSRGSFSQAQFDRVLTQALNHWDRTLQAATDDLENAVAEDPAYGFFKRTKTRIYD